MVLSWGWAPDLVSSAEPSAEEAAVQLPAPSAIAAEPQDAWKALPAAGVRYDAKKVATISFAVPQPIVDELAPEAPPVAQPPAAQTSSCRKHLRTLHLPKAVPKATGLLDKTATDKTAKADPNKAVAILNQRILKADDCLKRLEPRGG
jgi:hypothetical protein